MAIRSGGDSGGKCAVRGLSCDFQDDQQLKPVLRRDRRAQRKILRRMTTVRILRMVQNPLETVFAHAVWTISAGVRLREDAPGPDAPSESVGEKKEADRKSVV